MRVTEIIAPNLLRRGEIGYMVLDHKLERDDLEAIPLGVEENVLVRPRHPFPSEVHLDHDEDDLVTRQYLKRFGMKTPRIERRYLDDVYGLIDGVRHGLGSAVLPRHLIKGSFWKPSVRGARSF